MTITPTAPDLISDDSALGPLEQGLLYRWGRIASLSVKTLVRVVTWFTPALHLLYIWLAQGLQYRRGRIARLCCYLDAQVTKVQQDICT